jgi:hypothetical protein
VTVSFTASPFLFNLGKREDHGPKTARSATGEEEIYYPHKSSIQATIRYQLRTCNRKLILFKNKQIGLPTL